MHREPENDEQSSHEIGQCPKWIERQHEQHVTRTEYQTMMKKKIYSVLALAGVLAGGALGPDEYQEWRHGEMSELAYTHTRGNFIRKVLSNAGQVDTLVLGDSISEMTWLNDVCGETFNASAAGATIGDVASLAPLAIERIRPKVIVLEVGTNNLWSDPTPTDEFKRQYLELLHSLPGRKILVGIPNSPAASDFVRSMARQGHTEYVEPVTGDLTQGGGVHPTAEGAAVYRQRIRQACVSKRLPLS